MIEYVCTQCCCGLGIPTSAPVLRAPAPANMIMLPIARGARIHADRATFYSAEYGWPDGFIETGWLSHPLWGDTNNPPNVVITLLAPLSTTAKAVLKIDNAVVGPLRIPLCSPNSYFLNLDLETDKINNIQLPKFTHPIKANVFQLGCVDT